MKCPLLTGAYIIGTQAATTSDIDCLGKECAWYDSIIQQCLIYALHTDLAYLSARLTEIKDNMPTWKQFTK